MKKRKISKHYQSKSRSKLRSRIYRQCKFGRLSIPTCLNQKWGVSIIENGFDLSMVGLPDVVPLFSSLHPIKINRIYRKLRTFEKKKGQISLIRRNMKFSWPRILIGKSIKNNVFKYKKQHYVGLGDGPTYSS